MYTCLEPFICTHNISGMKKSEKSPIVFFDFDGTLTTRDTFGVFAVKAVGRLHYIRALLLSSPFIIGWKLGIVSNSAAKQHLFSRLYKGMSWRRFESLGQNFADTIDRILRPQGHVLLEQHLSIGAEIWIVSASLGTWIRPWAKRHGLAGVMATEAEFLPDETLSGRFSTPNCHGKEKVNRIRERFPDLDRRISFAYGDSKEDLPMIQICDKGAII